MNQRKRIKEIKFEYKKRQRGIKKEIDNEKIFKEKKNHENIKRIKKIYSTNNIRENKVNNSDNIRKVFMGWSIKDNNNFIKNFQRKFILR